MMCEATWFEKEDDRLGALWEGRGNGSALTDIALLGRAWLEASRIEDLRTRMAAQSSPRGAALNRVGQCRMYRVHAKDASSWGQTKYP
jgi:hypothetical protein